MLNSDEVGSSLERNKEFQEKFSKSELLKKIISKSKPLILDVGAHEGQSVSYFKKLFPNSIIHSFEADNNTCLLYTSDAADE